MDTVIQNAEEIMALLRASSVWKILLDPKVFNYVIMTLYLINSFRWIVSGSVADGCYWLSALAITATVTWGYNH